MFVLVDDWGYNDLGARSTFMPFVTPTIDALMDEGVSLTNYYAYEMCGPARGAFLTGRYAFRLGMQNATNERGIKAEMALEEITIGQEMQSAGYRTYIVGKWVSSSVCFKQFSSYKSNCTVVGCGFRVHTKLS